MFNQKPNHYAEGNNKEDDSDHGIEAFHAINGHIQEVEEENDDVDDDNYKVEATGITNTPIIETTFATIPISTKQGAGDETANDL